MEGLLEAMITPQMIRVASGQLVEVCTNIHGVWAHNGQDEWTFAGFYKSKILLIGGSLCENRSTILSCVFRWRQSYFAP